MTRGAYSYAAAKIRVLERHLMDDADLTRVIDAKDPDIAFKAFNSLDYAGELLDLEAKDYRVAMDRKMARLKKVLEKVVPDARLIRLLFIERDYYNIKVLFKERATGEDYEEHLETGEGMTKADQLRRYIIEELPADIDEKIKKDIDELKVGIGESNDPEKIENLVDQRLNQRNQELAKKIGNQFIVDLYKHLADKNNVSIFLRAKRLGKARAWFEERVNPGGFIDRATLVNLFDQDAGELVRRLPGYFGKAIEESVDQYQNDPKISTIELGMNKAVMDHLLKAKLVGAGPEVVVAYYFAKKFAIKNLSTIMALKFGGVDSQEIRKQLTQAYSLTS